jgi:PiT family inorganic phosphate transporter
MKAVGIMAALLFSAGVTNQLEISLPIILAAAAALTIGTAFGGWGIVKTVGKDIFPLRPLDGLVSQTASASVILLASAIGAPVSTSQVVASSVVGIGLGRGRVRHVDWTVVRTITTTWLTTIPAAAACAALTLPLWRALP